METLVDFCIQIGLNIVKNKISDEYQKSRLTEELKKYLKRKRKINTNIPLGEEIDFQGLSDYICTDMLSDIQQWILGESAQMRKEARETVRSKSSYYAQAHCPAAEKRVHKIITDCCSILKAFYRKRVSKELLYVASEIEDNITNAMENQMRRHVNELKDEIEKADKFSIEKT